MFTILKHISFFLLHDKTGTTDQPERHSALIDHFESHQNPSNQPDFQNPAPDI